MLFSSFQYWIFFVIVAVLFYSVPFRFGKLVLLLASYIFYMWWDPRFIVLILTSTVADYFLGIWLEATSRSEEHTSELQSRFDLVCRLLLEKKKKTKQ